jgi:hypothetical protein
LPWGIFQFDEYGQEYPLVIPVAGKQDPCKFIETFHSLYFVVAYFDFRGWNVFHPCLFDANQPIEGVGLIPGNVKIFRLWQLLMVRKRSVTGNPAIP